MQDGQIDLALAAAAQHRLRKPGRHDGQEPGQPQQGDGDGQPRGERQIPRQPERPGNDHHGG